ncbi:MAG: 2OG-Fe(II) oxygenase [Rhizomicrobium sp.]
MIDFDAITRAPVSSEPFPHFATANVLSADALRAIDEDFPAISQPGIFPLSELEYGAAFADLIAQIESVELEAIMEEKFGVKLSDRPLMITVRGHCRSRDGRIHNDSKDKLITCLLYLNASGWNEQGGRLRFLRDEHDLESTIVEVAPEGGNFVSFKRTENSWHGHAPYEGPRRYVMFNWLTSEVVLAKNIGRHKISAAFKRLQLFSGE